MKKNHFYLVEVRLMNNDSLLDYNQYIPKWKSNYNLHIVKDNPKEIKSIVMTKNNTMLVEVWTEKPLPKGREVQSLRRLSQEMANTNPNFVVGKSHVLRTVKKGSGTVN